MQIDLLLGVLSFTGVVLLLVGIIIAARSQLVSSGEVSIEINGDSSNPIIVPSGNKLLQTLAENKIFLSSACGGGGTCSQCKCQISDGGGSILPTEESHFNSKEKKDGWRLSCQVAVKNDLKITIPEEVFGVKEWECEVISNDNVATFIKELILKLPEGEDPYLEGHKCKNCGSIFLGERNVCSSCFSRDTIEPIKLSNTGKLYSYSIVFRSFPGIEVPYISAIVDLDGGGTLKGNLIDCEPDPEKIDFDMPVEVIFDDALGRKDKDGNSYISYFFKPIS